MSKPGIFYKVSLLGKERYPCEILGSFLCWKVIRFPTIWDNSWESYRIRIKFFWNVEES
jgi:hypothetical protein